MADVPLREYVDDLRDLLHAGKYADAFALGRHILFYFPKHIETYTLLAQVCLEVNDLAGATDLLRRVLSADPENVLALAGMALLSESQEKLDDTLWYLERAYEIQPSNDDLRREVLRVREVYYGTAAARLELTPGALARVYARQGQYAQAVNEFRRLLRNDSKRFDARVGLAETLFRAGRTDEAAQVAQGVMADAPFALKPNLILGYLWSQNAVPEGQQFLNRAQQLDPEHRTARKLIGDNFADGQSPRLPALGDRAIVPEAEQQVIGDVSLPPAGAEAAGSRAAEFLRELDRAEEPEPAAQEPLIADLDVLSLVESIPHPAVASETRESPAASNMVARTEEAGTTGPAVPEQEMSVESVADASGSSAEAPAPAEEEAEAEKTGGAGVVPGVVMPLAVESESAQPQGSQPTEAEASPSSVDQPKAEGEKVVSVSTEGAAFDLQSPPPRRRKEGVSPEAIAAAAAALATSIALDKSNQPAPTRRSHSAVPKVRPVIRGAAEKLPVWLRLGTTPAAASALFEQEPPSPTDAITPLKTSTQNHPDWLVEAQEVAAKESALQQERQDLPDWLKVGATTEAAKPTPESAQEDLPSWLRDARQFADGEVGETESREATVPNATEPDRLQEQTDKAPTITPMGANQLSETAVPSTEGTTATTAEAQSVPSEEIALSGEVQGTVPSEPGVDKHPLPTREELPQESPHAVVAEPVQEPAPEEPERAPAPAMPDSATMLQMARDKRDGGDLKGALELYERVMHRRPNYLDQVIGDLQGIISAGGAPTTANRLLGEAFAMVGRFKESLEQYRIAMGK